MIHEVCSIKMLNNTKCALEKYTPFKKSTILMKRDLSKTNKFKIIFFKN